MKKETIIKKKAQKNKPPTETILFLLLLIVAFFLAGVLSGVIAKDKLNEKTIIPKTINTGCQLGCIHSTVYYSKLIGNETFAANAADCLSFCLEEYTKFKAGYYNT